MCRHHSNPRRINPTPVGKSTAVFQANISLSAGNSVFTDTPTTSSSPSLHEDRRLLFEERNKQGNKFTKKQRKGFKRLENKSESTTLENYQLKTASTIEESKIPLLEDRDSDHEAVSLSAVTDKTQIDKISLCYSKLLKGAEQ